MLPVGKLCGWERGGGLGAQTALLPQLIDSVRRLKPRKNTLGHGRRPDDVFEEDFFFFLNEQERPAASKSDLISKQSRWLISA